MSKSVAIIQSNYIPWKGYFDIVNLVDEFIIFDDVQYTKRDWRNRNAIKASDGVRWLTVPVVSKGRYHQLICETRVSDRTWAGKHWAALCHAYRKAPHFRAYGDHFEALYRQAGEEVYLSHINYLLIRAVCDVLGITTKLTWSMDYPASGSKTDRLVAICRAASATRYLSGPSARSYIEPEKFAASGIELSYMDYSGYPEYSQLHGEFQHKVSILDLLFNQGVNARRFMKSF